MICLLTTFIGADGRVMERGHMAWIDANEAVTYARLMRFGIDMSRCDITDPPCPVRQGIAEGLYDHASPLSDVMAIAEQINTKV